MDDSSDQKKVKAPKTPRRVLSMDGGGIRGLLLLEKLILIEEKTGKRIYELFDTVVGTSTGGLVTILLTIPTKKNKGTANEGLPMRAVEAKEAYVSWASRIFPPAKLNTYSILGILILVIVGFVLAGTIADSSPTLCLIARIVLGIGLFLILHRMFTPVFQPFYKRKNLLAFIEEYYDENISLKDALTNVGICATIIPYGESFLFNTMRAKLNDTIHTSRIADIAAATSAAPTYFPPVEIDLERLTDDHNFKLHDELKAKHHLPHNDHRACHFESLPHWASTKEREPLHEGKFMFEDGGTSSNNPAKLGLRLDKALMKIQKLKYKEYEIKLLSLGTGTVSGIQDDPTKYTGGFLATVFSYLCCWCPTLIPSNTDGGLDNVIFRIIGFDPFSVSINSYNTHVDMEEKFDRKDKEGNYVRYQFKITSDQLAQMDNTSQKNITSLINAAQAKLTPENLQPTYKLLGIHDQANTKDSGNQKNQKNQNSGSKPNDKDGLSEPLVKKKNE